MVWSSCFIFLRIYEDLHDVCIIRFFLKNCNCAVVQLWLVSRLFDHMISDTSSHLLFIQGDLHLRQNPN